MHTDKTSREGIQGLWRSLAVTIDPVRNRHQRLSRLLRPALVVLVTAPALSFAAAAIESPTPAVAAEDFLNILPPSEITAEWSNVSGNVGTVPMPNCGSINIAPQSNAGNNNSTWTVTSQIGSGSTVFVGQEWTVRGQIDTQVPFKGTFGNDGPDPLNLDLIPQGPVASGAAPVAEQVGAFGGPYTGGDGDTGPVAARGAWGYQFDANSNPKAASSAGDGADAIVTVTLKATGPGEVQMKRFKVTGHDGTPIAGSVNCEIFLGWYWNVIEMQDPIAKLDFATTDASYSPVVLGVTGDRTTGRHGVIVDVLANDDDPNENFGCDGECGIDPDIDIRIASWDASKMACGDPTLNGKVPTVANFDSLSIGPCTVYPTLDAEAFDEAGYTMVQRSGLRTANSAVLVDIVGNQAPTINDAEGSVEVGTDFNASLAPFNDDFDGDPVTCVTDSLALDPNVSGITVTITEGCQLSWTDDGSDNSEGLITLSYRACDSHPTLQDIARGASYDKHFLNPADDDLTATTTRRCTVGKVEIDRKAQAPAFGLPITAVNDYDVLDMTYFNEYGPFSLDIDVAENDLSFATAENVSVSLYGGGYPPSQATVSVVEDRLQVSSTSLSPQKLTIGYRICGTFENIGQRCATAKAIITIIRNLPPITTDDLFGVTPRTPSVRQVATNDVDPENAGPMTCSTSNHPSNPAGAFDSVDVDANCNISFDASNDFTGDATIEYNICDNHKLATPEWAAKTYSPLLGPGGSAPRCRPGVAHFTFTNFVIALPPPVDVAPKVPTCVDDAFQIKSDTITAVDVLVNDSDLDQNNQAGVLSLPPPAEEATSQGGKISSIGGKIQYTPKAGFTGIDIANYNVLDSDGNGCSAVITFTVVIDTDGDGIPDAIDPDANGDGILDAQPPQPQPQPQPLPQPQPTNPLIPDDGQLPATGSTTGPTTRLALVIMLLGLGLVVIASRRRRPTTAKG